jgi:hypothetical protein
MHNDLHKKKFCVTFHNARGANNDGVNVYRCLTQASLRTDFRLIAVQD